MSDEARSQPGAGSTKRLEIFVSLEDGRRGGFGIEGRLMKGSDESFLGKKKATGCADDGKSDDAEFERGRNPGPE